MTKKKAITKKPASPALIVFGTIDGKPRAGTFSEAEAALARKAAAELGLSMLEVSDKATRELAIKLRPGIAHANASGFIGAAPKVVFAKLTGGIAGEGKGNDGEPRRPKNWDDISVGDIVLSQDVDPADGWWSATVISIQKDIISLRWHTRSDKRSFKKHKFNLALLWPGEDLEEISDEAQGQKSAYPDSWGMIAASHIVLVQEDGPIGQFWNCGIQEAVGNDRFKLQWEGYPDVPSIERSRHSLALIYSKPGSNKRQKDS